MQQVEVIREVRAPIDEVWALYTDHLSWNRWAGLGHVSLAHTGSPLTNGVGCVRVFSNFGFHVHEKVLSFDPPRRMTYTVVSGGLPMRNHFGEVDFAAHGDTTRIQWRCRFEPVIPGTGKLLQLGITRVFARALAGFARQL